MKIIAVHYLIKVMVEHDSVVVIVIWLMYFSHKTQQSFGSQIERNNENYIGTISYCSNHLNLMSKSSRF